MKWERNVVPFCVICLPVSKPGQPEDAGRQLKKKRKKLGKQASKTKAPSVKQAVSGTNKPTPGQKAAPQASKSSPQGVTQSRNESLVTGEDTSGATVWLKFPGLRWLLASCFTPVSFGEPLRSSAELKTSSLIPCALKFCAYVRMFVTSPLGGSLETGAFSLNRRLLMYLSNFWGLLCGSHLCHAGPAFHRESENPDHDEKMSLASSFPLAWHVSSGLLGSCRACQAALAGSVE